MKQKFLAIKPKTQNEMITVEFSSQHQIQSIPITPDTRTNFWYLAF